MIQIIFFRLLQGFSSLNCMPKIINLLFADKAEESGGEEATLYNECCLEVNLFSALIFSEEDESAVVAVEGEVIFLIPLAEVIKFSFLLEDISVEEQSDISLKSSLVF